MWLPAPTLAMQPNCSTRAVLFAGVSAHYPIIRGEHHNTRQEEL
jgi:hypothetical protein